MKIQIGLDQFLLFYLLFFNQKVVLHTFIHPVSIYCLLLSNLGTTATAEPPGPLPPVTCEAPWSLVPPQTLPTLWRIVYWTCQFLTWLVHD